MHMTFNFFLLHKFWMCVIKDLTLHLNGAMHVVSPYVPAKINEKKNRL